MIARGYVEAGAKVYVASRKEADCRAVAEELSKQGRCVALAANLSTQEGCRELAGEIASREPEVHILVNNAGANWGAPLAEFPDSAFDRCFDLNVKGVFHLTVALLPQLEKAARPGDPARVINIGRFGDAIRGSCPLGRIGEPEDMAGVAIYLSSRAGAYVTGAVLPVDGGIATTV
jgi:NAD(P)-dependent dehydrogenase (short-subunit alcohol dehydrogenase family)